MKKIFIIFLVSTTIGNAQTLQWPKDKNALTPNLIKTYDHFLINLKKAGSPPALFCDKPIQKNPILDPDFTDGGTACTNFISTPNTSGVAAVDENGYGIWGQEIVKYLDEKGENSIFFSNKLTGMDIPPSACPNWKNLNYAQKNHFWVWVFASIARVESTCRPWARNLKGTNGVATGLLQLNERRSDRKWRGDDCSAKSVSSTKNNLRCGLNIMEELLRGSDGEYKSTGALWGSDSHSYWAHLRRSSGGKIAKLIAKNPNCQIP